MMSSPVTTLLLPLCYSRCSHTAACNRLRPASHVSVLMLFFPLGNISFPSVPDYSARLSHAVDTSNCVNYYGQGEVAPL